MDKPTVEEFSGSAVKYYAAVVKFNNHLEKENEILKLESTNPHTVNNLARKNGELAGKLDKYKQELQNLEVECLSLRDLNLEFGETHDMQIGRITELEKKIIFLEGEVDSYAETIGTVHWNACYETIKACQEKWDMDFKGKDSEKEMPPHPLINKVKRL